MTIHFTKRDVRLMRLALVGFDLEDSPHSMRVLADAVRAAFQQQLEYEANYLAAEMADDPAGFTALLTKRRGATE